MRPADAPQLYGYGRAGVDYQPRHRQLIVPGYNIEVDVALAPYCKMWWDAGLTSSFSCQGSQAGELQTRIHQFCEIMDDETGLFELSQQQSLGRYSGQGYVSFRSEPDAMEAVTMASRYGGWDLDRLTWDGGPNTPATCCRWRAPSWTQSLPLCPGEKPLLLVC